MQNKRGAHLQHGVHGRETWHAFASLTPSGDRLRRQSKH